MRARVIGVLLAAVMLAGCATHRISEDLEMAVGATYRSTHIELTRTEVKMYGTACAIPKGAKKVRIDHQAQDGFGTVVVRFDDGPELPFLVQGYKLSPDEAKKK